MWGLITLLIVGLVAGFIARVVVPGPNPLSFIGTIGLGVVGSFIGGFLGYIIFGHNITDGAFQTSGLLGSLLGAVIALLIWRKVQTKKA